MKLYQFPLWQARLERFASRFRTNEGCFNPPGRIQEIFSSRSGSFLGSSLSFLRLWLIPKTPDTFLSTNTVTFSKLLGHIFDSYQKLGLNNK